MRTRQLVVLKIAAVAVLAVLQYAVVANCPLFTVRDVQTAIVIAQNAAEIELAGIPRLACRLAVAEKIPVAHFALLEFLAIARHGRHERARADVQLAVVARNIARVELFGIPVLTRRFVIAEMLAVAVFPIVQYAVARIRGHKRTVAEI